MDKPYEIDFRIIQEILSNAYDACQKTTTRKSSQEIQLDLLTILQSYTKVLESKDLDTSRDTKYYKFLLDLSVENNKLREPDWFTCFEKLRVKYEYRRIAYHKYGQSLLSKSIEALHDHAHTIRQNRNSTFIRSYKLEDMSNIEKVSTIPTQERAQKPRKLSENEDKSTIRNTLGHFGPSSQRTKERSSKVPNNLEYIDSDKENSPKSIALSFIEDFPEKEVYPRGSQSKHGLASLNISLANRFSDKLNVTHTPYLGKMVLLTSIEENKHKPTKSVDFYNLQRGSKTTGVLDSAGSNRGQVKDTGIQVERLLEELMGRSPAETRRRDSEDAREEPEWSREEAVKVTSHMFCRWCIYVQKKKAVRKEKDEMVKKILSAMEYNYQTLLTKGFISLGFEAINRRQIREKLARIRETHEGNVKRQAFERYRVRFERHVIKRNLKEKAGKFFEKKLLKRQMEVWRVTSKQKVKTIRPIRSLMQAKMMVYLLCRTYRIDVQKPYHEIFDELSQRIHCPVSREPRMMEAISVLNDDISKQVFVYWKAYVRKCLDSKDYHKQHIKSGSFLFWKHYTRRNQNISFGQTIMKQNRLFHHKERIFKAWKTLSCSERRLKHNFQLITKKLATKAKRKYYQNWTSLFENTVYNRDMDSFSTKFSRNKIKQKVFRVLGERASAKLTRKAITAKAFEVREEKIMQKCFEFLRVFTKKMRSLRTRAQRYAREKSTKLMGGYMEQWISNHSTSQRVNKFYCDTLKLKLFNAIKRVQLYNNRMDLKVQRFYEESVAGSSERTLEACFFAWKRRTDVRYIQFQVMSDRASRLLQVCLEGWRRSVGESHYHREIVAEALEVRDSRIMELVLSGWQAFLQRRRNNNLLKKKVGILKRFNVVGRAFKQWKIYLKGIREEKYENEMCEKIYEASLLRRSMMGLKRCCVEARGELMISEQFADEMRLKKAFCCLRSWFIKERADRELEEGLKTQRLNNASLMIHFEAWRSRVVAKQEIKSISEEIRRRSVSRLLASSLDQWSKKLMIAQAFGRVGSIVVEKHLCTGFNSLLEVLRRGKQEQLLCSFAEKYEDRGIIQAFAEDWRQMTQEGAKHEHLVRQFQQRSKQNLQRSVFDVLQKRLQDHMRTEQMLQIFRESSQRVQIKLQFEAFKQAVQKSIRLRKIKQEYARFNRHKLIHLSFRGLKQNWMLIHEGMEKATPLFEKTREVLKVKALCGLKSYSNRRTIEKAIIDDFEAKRVQRIREAAYTRWLEEYSLSKAAAQISQRFEKIDSEIALTSTFNTWRGYTEGAKERKVNLLRAQELHEDHLKIKALKGFGVMLIMGDLKKYQASVADHYYLRMTFKRLLKATFMGLEKKYRMIEAIKYYATKLMKKSMFQMKRYTKARFAMRYQKIMGIKVEDKENRPPNYSHREKVGSVSQYSDLPLSKSIREETEADRQNTLGLTFK